jgi:hypothetical protein
MRKSEKQKSHREMRWLSFSRNIQAGHLCTLDFPAFQAGSADIHLLGTALGFNTNGFDVRFPDSV